MAESQNQLQAARDGKITPEVARVAQRETVCPELLRDQLAAGKLVIPANRVHLKGVREGAVKLDPCAIGRAVSTKINANIGASPVSSCSDQEVAKLTRAVQFGADAVMDLSTGGDLDAIRETIIAHATVPIGTVPMYSMIIDKPIEDLTHDDILRTVEHQAKQGVDFFTIHAGLLRSHLPAAMKRKMGICSRGGSLLAKWMTHHKLENPMYTLFDEITAIMKQYDVAYSLGDGLRPGCLADASDEAQFAELDVLGELVTRSRAMGVQVMVEGPGHVPFNEIQMNMERQADVCDGAPFYVLGPIVTDVFPGYDHITSAIGATAAATYGASFLCYVTPAEHLSLPNEAEVREGCVAYKIAAHAGDVARGLPGARDWDDAISDARATFDWKRQLELAYDSERAEEIRMRDVEIDSDYCSMCGREWCAVRLSREVKASIEAEAAETK
jgi:phosphomethylpyrimidine synthase